MIVESTRNGHRLFYAGYFSRLTDDPDAMYLSETRNAAAAWRMLWARRLVLSTADDYLVFALLVSFLRALLLRPTRIVLIRAEHALDQGGARALVKTVIYKILRALPLARSVSIMPHEVEPRLATITNGSIYDPAFFENSKTDRPGNPNGAQLKAGQMPDEVVFLGVLSEARNIGTFIELFRASKTTAAKAYGRRAENLPDSLLDNPGNVVVTSTHLSDAEFTRVFSSASSVWCGFRPDYDNFSGIFCNAVRFSMPVWLTEGSRLHRFSDQHGGQVMHRLKSATQSFVLVTNIHFDIDAAGSANRIALQ